MKKTKNSQVPKVESFQSRPDKSMANIVDKGIALQKTHGFKYAANYLKERMVPMHVALRVLLRPLQRRKSESKR